MVTVQVPVRIRLEVDADRLHTGLVNLVNEATWRAAGRAVDRAADRTGGGPAAPEVSVSFTGDQLPAGVAAELETGTRAAVTAATARFTGRPGGGQGGAGAPPRQQQVGPGDAPGTGAEAGPAPVDAGPRTATVWDSYVDSPDNLRRWGRAIRERYGDALPAQIGIIALITAHSVGIFAQREPSQAVLFNGKVTDLVVNEPEVVRGTVTTTLNVRSVPYSPAAGGAFRLRYLSPGHGIAPLRQAYVDFHAPLLRSAVLEQLRRTDPKASDAQAEELARRTLQADAGRWAAANAGVGSLLVLETGDHSLLITSGREWPHDIDVELVPIAHEVPLEDGDQKGDGTGPGGAKAGGSLGDTAEGGQIWPVAGIGGEQLVCEPFLVEPVAAALADDHGLTDRMRALAAALEVPECGYLGKFAINCAMAIAARAWAVGVSSVDAATTTEVTVRPDGDGNNGFVDIRPGASPDFDYLRQLGRVAAAVHAFGLDVAEAYRDPRNAPQVGMDAEAGSDPAGWTLRFLDAFRSKVVDGYMYLYAETCRMLLLQQLRSSAEGIRGRQTRFDQTLEFFTQVLDVLGETVVQLSTLRTAIRHSLAVMSTGTVRQVLATPELLVDPESGYVTELDPPIRLVPERILAAVGDATVRWQGRSGVVTFQGRDWTVKDLDAAIGMRRGLVNRVDPMFLQVADLDELYVRSQGDPGYASRYLSGLLSEMAKANEGMTRKASSSFTGAFFALEASQYLRREGGRDSRGLRFELSGIHLLADEQLAAVTGYDRLYSEGVNAAIGRKADFDDFVRGFATFGIIVLSVLCAPLGALVTAAVVGTAGIALAVHDVHEADRLKEEYRALEDPELFLRWQEVQQAQLMAQLSIAFAVFDVIPLGKLAHAVVGEAAHALRVAERAGVGMAARSLARSARRALLRNMTAEILGHAAIQAVTQAAVGEVMNVLLEPVIKAVLVPWLRQEALEHGDPAEVQAILAELAAALPPGEAQSPGGAR